MSSQIPYILFVLVLFLAYGSLVRRGIVTGRAILYVGALVALAAAAASYLNLPFRLRHEAPVALTLIPPLTMALCAAVCVGLAYRMQQVTDLVAFPLGDTHIIVRAGPVTGVTADALLVPAETTLRMSGGAAARMVGAVGGRAIEKEAHPSAPAGLGKVVTTGGGRLAIHRILHAVVFEPGHRVDERALRRGMENAAQQARKAGAETVVVPIGYLPGMTTGQVALATGEAVLKYQRAFAEIVFLALEPRQAALVREAVERAAGITEEAPR
jgi:O-acetyl-ADP-ribose deacetylase (regulator of RNase III)